MKNTKHFTTSKNEQLYTIKLIRSAVMLESKHLHTVILSSTDTRQQVIVL